MRVPLARVRPTVAQFGALSAPDARPTQNLMGEQLAGLGQSLQRAGAGIGRLGAGLQDDIDAAYVQEIDNEASEALRGDQSAYEQKLGRDAYEGFEAVATGIRKREEGYLKRAKSDNQAALIRRAVGMRVQSALARAESWRDSQVKVWQQGAAEAGVQSAINDYHGAVGDPRKMQLFRALARMRARKAGELRGESGDQLALSELAVTTQLHEGALDALLTAGRVGDAAQHLETFGGEMAPESKTRAQRALESHARRQKAALDDEDAGRLELQLVAEAQTGTATVNVAGVEIPIGSWENEQRAAAGQPLVAAEKPVPLMAHAMRRLDEMRATGKIGHEQALKVLGLIEKRVDREVQMAAAASKQALEAARQEAQLAGHRRLEDLSPTVREALRLSGEEANMELWLRQGQQTFTTAAGNQFLATVSDRELREKHPTPETLEAQLRSRLSQGDMRLLLAKWRAAHDKPAEGDKLTIDDDILLRPIAREAGVLPADGDDASDEQLVLWERFKSAVLQQANAKMAAGMKRNEAISTAGTEVALDTMQTSSGPVPFLAAPRAQQNEGWIDVQVNQRRVFNRNVSDDEKAKLLERIRSFNTEAAERNKTLPADQQLRLRPETLAGALELWEEGNVRRREETAKNLVSLRTETWQDRDVARAHWKLQHWNWRDPQRAADSLDEIMKHPWRRQAYLRESGLSEDQLAKLERLVRAEAGR